MIKIEIPRSSSQRHGQKQKYSQHVSEMPSQMLERVWGSCHIREYLKKYNFDINENTSYPSKPNGSSIEQADPEHLLCA